MNDEVLYSRSGNTNPLGKCTEEIKSMVDETTKEAMQALAFAHGKNLSEYVRHVLHMHCFGHANMLRNSISKNGDGE